MTSPSMDRRYGLNSSAAIKAACKAATTGNVALSGAQTIDGVACVTGDRVLVLSQTDSTQNGVYLVDSAAWSRDADFSDNRSLVRGTIITVVQGGASFGNTYWQITTTDDPIVLGTSAITFARSLASDSNSVSFVASGASSVVRTAQDKGRERVTVKDTGAAGNDTQDDTAHIQAALNEHLGRDVGVPSGVYKCTAPIVLGARVAPGTTSAYSTFSYNSLVGEGPAIYTDNTTGSPYATGHTPQSILHFTAGSGLKINNSYQSARDLSITGTQVGGSVPSASAVGSCGNIGLQLSGVNVASVEQTDSHGGHSIFHNVRVSGFDTGYATPGLTTFLAYDEITNCDAIACANGWVFQGTIFDLRIRGGKTLNCPQVGMYLWSPGHAFQIIGHMFEGCGTITQGIVKKESASVIVANGTTANFVGCSFSDDTSLCVLRDARLELNNCDVEQATKIYGPGELILHNSVGREIDVPISQDLTAWNLTNCAVAPVDTSSDPHAFHITSSVKAATQIDLTVPLPALVDPRAIQYNAAGNLSRHAVKLTFRMRIDGTAGKAPAPVPVLVPASLPTPAYYHWTAAAGFSPSLTARAYDASTDSWADGTGSDPTAWDFTDHKWWTVNLYMAIRATGSYITDTLKEFTVVMQFNGGSIDYVATPLSVFMTPPTLTFYQQNS